MVNIYRSRLLFGNATCIEDDPDVLTLRNCIFNPDDNLGTPGLYDCGRKLVLQSCYTRGPDPEKLVPSVQFRSNWDEIDGATDEPLIFIGRFHHHYGHFLLSTLARLWAVRDLPPHRIVCYSPSLQAELAKPYVREILGALNVDAARFVTFTEPVKLRNVVLPCASLEEQNYAHRVYARFCNDIGDRLVADARLSPGSSDRPLFLSKRALRSGIRMIENEDEICEHLATRGLDIANPEQLTLAEQIALWRNPRPVVAFTGSALHTSVFTPRARLVCIEYDRYTNSNFTLTDWANRSVSAYYSVAPDALESLGTAPGFRSGVGANCTMRARDPVGVADAILRAIDAANVEAGMSRIGGLSGGPGEPTSENLSRGRPTIQSSSIDDPAAGGPGATSGFLSGAHQFHTAHEAYPWWQVDLGDRRRVDRIVVYNRTDAVPERAAHVAIEVSDDGIAFETIYRRDDDEPFGGLNGTPLTVTLDPVVAARWIRLSLRGPTFFHLDQVEVFGRSC